MPIKIAKVKGKNCYKSSTPTSKLAKCTTKKKAEAQKRLINAADHNPDFRAKLRDAVMKG